jgi:hypothetical protein
MPVCLSLLDLANVCQQQYENSSAQGIGLEFLCNMDMDGKARACHHVKSGGKTVYVIVIKGQGFVKSESSTALLQLFRDICDLLNRQPHVFWKPFLEVSDVNASKAWMCKRDAKNRIFAALLDLLRQEEIRHLIADVRCSDHNKGQATCSIVIKPAASQSESLARNIDVFSAVMLYNNLEPTNDSRNCLQGHMVMNFLDKVFRIKAAYVPHPIDDDPDYYPMLSAAPQSKRQKRAVEASEKSRSGAGVVERAVVDLTKGAGLVIDLTIDKLAEPSAPSLEQVSAAALQTDAQVAHWEESLDLGPGDPRRYPVYPLHLR